MDARGFDIESFKQCIFCGADLATNASKEHVFPEVIGGCYTRYFVCRDCNNQFGKTFDSDLRRNPFVHAANKRFHFAGADMLKGQKINWRSPSGHSGKMGVPHGADEPVIIPSMQEDGSIDYHPDIFARDMVRRMRDSGAADSQVEEFKNRHANAPPNIYVPVPGPPGGYFCNRQELIEIEHQETAPFRWALVAKIAVEMYYASGLFTTVPADLVEVKAAVRAGDPKELSVWCLQYDRIQDLEQVPYQPFHSVCFGTYRGVLAGLVCFFGAFQFAVCLGRVGDPDIGPARTYYMMFPIRTSAEPALVELGYPSEVQGQWDGAMMGGAVNKWLASHGEYPQSES